MARVAQQTLKWVLYGLVLSIAAAWGAVAQNRTLRQMANYATPVADCGSRWFAPEHTWYRATAPGIRVEWIDWPARSRTLTAPVPCADLGADRFESPWVEVPECHEGQTFGCVAAGFPLPCLSARFEYFEGSWTSARRLEWSAGVPFTRIQDYDPVSLRALPLHPHAPGFVVNTAFWSPVAWCAGWPVVWLRRALVRRPGTCPRCRYDLRGELDSGCPECGWQRDGGARRGARP